MDKELIKAILIGVSVALIAVVYIRFVQIFGLMALSLGVLAAGAAFVLLICVIIYYTAPEVYKFLKDQNLKLLPKMKVIEPALFFAVSVYVVGKLALWILGITYLIWFAMNNVKFVIKCSILPLVLLFFWWI